MITIEMTSNRGDFILYEDNEPVINLKRTDWFSSAAETVYLGNRLRIKSNNIWATQFDIFENDHKVGGIKFNWKGGIHIDLMGQNYKKHVFFLKKEGIIKPRFELYNSNHRHILTLFSVFSWSNFRYNYTIKEKSRLADDVDIYELLMYCVYAAATYRKKRSNG